MSPMKSRCTPSSDVCLITRSLNRHAPATQTNESSYRAVAMPSIPHPGTCCKVVLYDRAVARPVDSSTSMIVFVTRCAVRGVPSAYKMIPSRKTAATGRPSSAAPGAPEPIAIRTTAKANSSSSTSNRP
jgi:hypothetical protein